MTNIFKIIEEKKIAYAVVKGVYDEDSLKKEDIGFSRPGDGLPPKEKPRLIGKVTKRNIKKNNKILNKDVV